MVAIMAVFEFPPKLSLSSLRVYRQPDAPRGATTVTSGHSVLGSGGERGVRGRKRGACARATHQVSTESRYGMKDCLAPVGSRSASALMTSPSVVSDLLMLAPSLSCVPVVPLLPARSDPAKSTRLILLWNQEQRESRAMRIKSNENQEQRPRAHCQSAGRGRAQGGGAGAARGREQGEGRRSTGQAQGGAGAGRARGSLQTCAYLVFSLVMRTTGSNCVCVATDRIPW